MEKAESLQSSIVNLKSSIKLRVAIIGAGDMGVRHAAAWQNLAIETEGAIQAEIVALVDDVAERLKDAQESFRLEDTALFSDYRIALARSKPDVVSVCIPTAFHAEVGITAMEYGAHVLIEKPLALTLEQADAVIQAAGKNGVLLAVGFMLRYSPAVQTVKQWLEQGKFGQNLLYTAENIMTIRPKIVMHAKNINGGPVMDYWCHHFDLWSYFFDSKPISVAGYGSIFAQGKPEVSHFNELAIDTAGVTVRYANGNIGQFSTSWGLPRNLSMGMLENDRLIGSNGIAFGNIRHELKLHYNAGDKEEILVTSNNLKHLWQDEITGFATAIVQGGKPLAGGAEGRAALVTSLAALKAIETGETVYLHE
jgi:myo-inositol 2-dehydrogenase / D-chiro-inositol 1-dehydrogenase